MAFMPQYSSAPIYYDVGAQTPSESGFRRKKRKRGDGPDATAPNFIHRPGHVAINPETKKVLVASAIKL